MNCKQNVLFLQNILSQKSVQNNIIMLYQQQIRAYQQKIKNKTDLLKVQTYAIIKKYWFKTFLLSIFIWVFLSRDISIQLNLNAPSDNNTSVVAKNTSSKNNRTKAVNTSLLSKSKTTGGKKKVAKKKKVWTAKQKRQLKYVKRYAKIAKTEMNKFGIPASITLAQGLLESNIGQSTLARRNNNHFGIKCFSRKCKKGHCSNFSDDSHKDFFRIFSSTWESYRAHSLLLKNNKRYSKLFKLGKKDYKNWAKGLKKAGYATDKTYADKLIRLIEELDLHQYDN